MKKYMFLTAIFLFATAIVSGDAVRLKTGEVVRGKIIRQTPVYIRIESNDGITMREYLQEKVAEVYYGNIEPADLTIIDASLTVAEGENREGLKGADDLRNGKIKMGASVPDLTVAGETLQQEKAGPAVIAKDDGSSFGEKTLKVFQFENEPPLENFSVTDAAEGTTDVAPDTNSQKIETPKSAEPDLFYPQQQNNTLFLRNELENVLQRLGLKDFLAEYQLGETPINISFEHVVLFLISYIFLCFPLFLLARKTAMGSAGLAFIPLINVVYMCAVGRKPLWWFFLLMLPVVQVIFFVLIWGGIAEACNKSKWLGILMLVPFINLLLPWYLVISK